MKRFLRWLREPEVIGPPGCPLFRRWTIFVHYSGKDEELVLFRRWHFFGFKLLIHHFYPNTEDADPHDHPRPLWTLVLKGGYLDLVPCSECQGKRKVRRALPNGALSKVVPEGEYPDVHNRYLLPCDRCKGRGLELGERMQRGRFRHRPAEHRHVTKVSSAGAWTLCLMGPKERDWGFWREGKLWQWQRYEERFGLSFRCDPDTGDRIVEVGNPTGQTTKEAAR